MVIEMLSSRGFCLAPLRGVDSRSEAIGGRGGEVRMASCGGRCPPPHPARFAPPTSPFRGGIPRLAIDYCQRPYAIALPLRGSLFLTTPTPTPTPFSGLAKRRLDRAGGGGPYSSYIFWLEERRTYGSSQLVGPGRKKSVQRGRRGCAAC